MSKLLLIVLTLLLLSLKVHSQNEKTINLILKNSFKDTCIVLIDIHDTVYFNRTIQVLKNSFKDTLNIGFNAVFPNETGELFISQIDNSKDESLDSSPEAIKVYNSNKMRVRMTKYLCIYNLSKRNISYINPDDQELIISIKREQINQ
jgi:hypothetical protein